MSGVSPNDVCWTFVGFSVLAMLTLPVVGCGTVCTNLDLPAIVAIKKVNVAEAKFFRQHGRYGELKELGPAGEAILPAEPAEGSVKGHRMTLNVSKVEYSVRTIPVEWGRTGFHSFYSDQTYVLRKGDGQPADRSSPEVP